MQTKSSESVHVLMRVNRLNKYVNICLTMQLSIPDTYANIEFDEDLQQILEEICKFLVFSTVRLRSNNNNNNNNVFSYHFNQLMNPW